MPSRAIENPLKQTGLLVKQVDHKKQNSTMRFANYKALIASKIATKARSKNPAGAGEVQATFRVNEVGKIDEIQIKKSTNTGLATHVNNILSSVQAPPPPEGVIYLGQPFKFN